LRVAIFLQCSSIAFSLPDTTKTPSSISIVRIGFRCYKVIACRVYFRILLKRGQTHSSKLQGGANANPGGGGQSHIKYRERQFPKGAGANQSQGGRKHPLAPPEINPSVVL
jgi:hypothetical protein